MQKQQDLVSSQEDYREKIETGGFLDAEDKQKEEKAIEEKRKAAEKAAKLIETRDTKEKTDEVLSKVYKALRSDYTPKDPAPVAEPSVTPKSPAKSKQYMAQSLSQYSKKEQKLIGRIYGILNAILPHDTAMLVINKVQEELSK